MPDKGACGQFCRPPAEHADVAPVVLHLRIRLVREDFHALRHHVVPDAVLQLVRAPVQDLADGGGFGEVEPLLVLGLVRLARLPVPGKGVRVAPFPLVFESVPSARRHAAFHLLPLLDASVHEALSHEVLPEVVHCGFARLPGKVVTHPPLHLLDFPLQYFLDVVVHFRLIFQLFPFPSRSARNG